MILDKKYFLAQKINDKPNSNISASSQLSDIRVIQNYL